ncbi:MAG: AraC family transcriptional regulator [Oceanipulchritudo sp.]
MKSMLLDFAQTVLQANAKLAVHPEYLGLIRRTDGWTTGRWERYGEWSVLYLIERGEVRIRYKGLNMAATPGDCLFIGGATHPKVVFSNPIELRELWFRVSGNIECQKGLRALRHILRFGIPVEGPSLIDHLAAENAAKGGEGGLLLSVRVALLLILCDGEWKQAREKTRKLSPYQKVHLVRWVRQNLASRPSPAQLADQVGLSPDYFGRVFRNTFGMPPRDWLIRQRIMAARRLLDEGGLSPSEVMGECGFDDLAHFSRQMKRLTGKTPGGGRGWKRKS